MILALIALGLPIAILAWFLFDCWQHQRELEKAERWMGEETKGKPL